MTPQPQTPLPSFAELVRLGLAKARAKHGAMRNLHEAYAVILEELDEFWDEVKAQKIDQDAALKELVHVGAMVQRAAEDCSLIPPATDPHAALTEEVGRLTEALRRIHVAYSIRPEEFAHRVSGEALAGRKEGE